ncbi:MAG: hypothetical protein V3V41_06165 [Candidatus Heimdallarchaeota archaeon]
MEEEQKMNEILAEIGRNIEDLSSRKTSIISNSNSTIDTILDDVRVIPDYIESLKNTNQELQQVNRDLEQKILATQQAVETVSTEIEINESKRSDLEATVGNKRNYKQELETKIAENQGKKTELEAELEHVSNTAKYKEEEFNQLEIKSKEEIGVWDAKIQESSTILEKAKEENKLIVYLMDAGLLDVPEAELVSIIASYPNGLKLAEIKEKVAMPPVRVQPTLNTLLENVLEYDSHSESYKILETIKKELS